ncbi:MAG: two-component sensor histidine kinase, partial [Blautia sp.]|nr:two-component sensor histidine kinase [Blautia sp.]
MKKRKGGFLKSLRFRIMIILVIMGIVPSVIVLRAVITNYADRTIANRSGHVRKQCEILSTLLIQENYLDSPYSAPAT